MRQQEEEHAYSNQDGYSASHYGNQQREKLRPDRSSRRLKNMLLPIISMIFLIAIYFVLQQQTIIQENAGMAQYDHTWTYIGFILLIGFIITANILYLRRRLK
ncbi:hypothetical protein [Tengunoibacter tsumagoiensis]|uniref:Uncharacterized protein n=1 Tax=Tengunoibacter tsumagoiensis TaxID=2014871 RepID=A0A401ZTG7_9CHLR|nr:hypothetical protein [Tengunoibacter tsumagoiensis]GCE10175.1 hypothetical protein KTT_00340 [Tengunoibacter tsumagoiensis]